jgi:uncharacterized membrane-anchored protein YhcB (DUF1043 family)
MAGVVFDWLHLAIALIFGASGVVGGLVAGVWRIAHIEQALRLDFDDNITKAKTDIDEKVETLVGQFRETFQALRQKTSDIELHMEKFFVGKAGFDDFRKEYREDMISLMAKIDHITLKPNK